MSQKNSVRPGTPSHGEIIDLAQRITNSLHQLEAMIVHVYGEGGDAFRTLSVNVQDNYLWGCADKASIIREQAELLNGWLLRANHKAEVTE